MCAKLVVLTGPRCGEALPIPPGGMTIGRDGGSGLCVRDRLLSRRHCTVEVADGRFLIRDLGSSNGTYVNGMPVRERPLAHGDRVRVGDSVLLFLQAEDQATGGSSIA